MASAQTGLARSEPARIRIPRIGVDAQTMSLGVTDNGMVQVPPLSQADRAGWYRLGPSPGEIGNAVVVGHVDSRELGPAVFFQLGALRTGDAIEVSRRDGTVTTFSVEAVHAYPKSAFPTDLVYGPTSQVGLRLVTCGGIFDETVGSYPDNVIAFATLSSWRRE